MRRLLCLTVGVVLAVSACSGSDDPSDDGSVPSATPTSEAEVDDQDAATPEPSEEPVADDLDVASDRAGVELEHLPTEPDEVTFPELAPQGANAAPDAQGFNAAPGGTGSIYDPSQQAANNFVAWFSYEAQTPQDVQRDTATVLYPDGVFVCAQLALGASTASIERVLSGTKGYTASGAAAIYKAAVNALCTWRNQGYMTYFDRNVASVQNAIYTNPGLSWQSGPPQVFVVGWFTKEVCLFLQNRGSTTGLWETLLAMRSGGQYAGYPAATMVQLTGNDDIALRRLVNLSVLHGCVGHHSLLGAFYTMA